MAWPRIAWVTLAAGLVLWGAAGPGVAQELNDFERKGFGLQSEPGGKSIEEYCQRRAESAAVGRRESAAVLEARRPPISGAFLLLAS